jgi:3-dehydroquinate dehydratase-2
MKILIINGPNLNLLGKREPEIYGNQSFEGYLSTLKSKFNEIELEYFQSNVEGELVDKLQSANNRFTGIVLNAASYTHTSVAIADAIAAIETPVVEVHISNVYSRNESIRHQSYMAKHCKGIITGFGLMGYDLAIQSYL